MDDFIPTFPVSPWQIREALNQLGLRDEVEITISQADQKTKDGWQFATFFVRDDPLVIALGAALGKTDAEMNALFDLAITL